MASITCGNCKRTHFAVDTVRVCYSDTETFPCGWLREGPYNEDGERPVIECDALAWETDRGIQCDAGHEHVHTEVRMREGWDYAADEYEAAGLLAYGVQPVGMDGGSINADMSTFRRVLAGG